LGLLLSFDGASREQMATMLNDISHRLSPEAQAQEQKRAQDWLAEQPAAATEAARPIPALHSNVVFLFFLLD
jgi:hypothetical protein